MILSNQYVKSRENIGGCAITRDKCSLLLIGHLPCVCPYSRQIAAVYFEYPITIIEPADIK